MIDSARVTHVPMEGRGGVADYRAGTNELTYHAGTQAPHGLRQDLSGLLGHPAERLRVVIPDIGGAFGQKAGSAARTSSSAPPPGCSGVRSNGSRTASRTWLPAGQAREETIEIDAAVKNDGTILALDVKMRLNQGAYPMLGTPSPLFGWIVRTMIGSAYRIGSMRWSFDVYMSNKASYGAYRGPWAAETLAREILIDRIAHELDLDPVEVRRRNLLDARRAALHDDERTDDRGRHVARRRSSGPPSSSTSTASVSEQRRAREQGRLLGVGFSTYIEPAPGPPDFFAALGFTIGGERAVARLEPDGHLTVMTTQAPHGQSHETTIAQIAATEFGVPMSHVRVLYGDTSVVPFSSMGTGGSRAATMASGSALHATRAVKQKALDYAGNVLEIAPDDLEIVDARIRVKGDPNSGMGLRELAQAVYNAPPDGEENDLRSTVVFNEPRGGYSGGTHVCFVEIDPETGIVHIPRYEVIEDCGSLINPAIVDGQIRGGIAQGIGIALYEHARYNEEGTFVSSTFLDYLVPTAMEIPTIGIEHFESPVMDEVNYRGVGEGGTIAAPAAVLNAVSDALGGVRVEQLPLTPDRVLALIDTASGAV